MKYLLPIKTKQPVKTKQQVPTLEPAGHYYSPIGPGDVKEEEGDSREYASPRKGPATGGSSIKIHPTEISKTQLETSDLEDDKVVMIIIMDIRIGPHFNCIAIPNAVKPLKRPQWGLAPFY